MAGANKICHCGASFKTTHSEIRKGGGKFCSKKCYHKSREGKRSTNWKGGRKKIRGYVELYKPEYPRSDAQGYIKEHRFIMEGYLGRALDKNEIVHHKNGIRDDNRVENLEVMTRRKHQSLHTKGNKKTKEHCKKISEAKKKISHLIERNNSGQFLGGVTYG
jgi:hypothetical protein